MSDGNKQLATISVLIVDDDENARVFLRSFARSLGCEKIEVVHSGQEALKRAKTMKPDIVFLDIEMPGVSGLETLQQLLVENAGQHVVMVSAHSSLNNVQGAIKSGAKGFVVKPYNALKIREALLNYLRSTASATPPA